MEEPSQKHGIDIVPPDNIASPTLVDAAIGERDVPWWTPTWSDVFVQLGWRWLLFLPAIALILSIVIFIPIRRTYIQALIGLWKLVVIVVALPTGMAFKAMRSIVQSRKDPFCIHCGYTLVGLPDGSRCPECGRRFSLAIVDEYRRDPQWFIHRWKVQHEVPDADAPFAAGAMRRKRSKDGT